MFMDECWAGLYAKGTPKGGYLGQTLAGPPKAASVHEMDMSPSQAGPGATKRRSKAGRNPTSAPGPYAQNWGNSMMPFMGMPGEPNASTLLRTRVSPRSRADITSQPAQVWNYLHKTNPHTLQGICACPGECCWS